MRIFSSSKYDIYALKSSVYLLTRNKIYHQIFIFYFEIEIFRQNNLLRVNNSKGSWQDFKYTKDQ